MSRLLARLLSRKTIYGASLAWGSLVLLGCGVVFASFDFAPGMMGEDEVRPDRLYHYHVSGLLTSALAFAFLVAGSLSYNRSVRTATLAEAARTVLLVEILAVAAGAGLTLAFGWTKEMLDALAGTFADQGDIRADVAGVLPPVLVALGLLLPTQGTLALVGSPVRRWLLLLLSPAAARPQMERAEALVPRLRGAFALLRREHASAHRIHEEIRELESDLAPGAPPPPGSEARLAESHRELVAALARLDRLEADNTGLMREMAELRSAAAKCARSPLLCGELRELLGLALEQGAMADNVRRHIRRSARLVRQLSGQPEEEGAEPAPAAPAGKDRAKPPPAGPGCPL